MALREYEYRGSTYQFDDADVPDGAVEVKAAPAPKNKQATPENKAVQDVDSKPRRAQSRQSS